MIIYKATNNFNKKIYVGQTVKSLQHRWANHCKKSKVGCRAIHSAIQKYGKENFTLEIIDTASSLEELNKKEAYWIAKLNCISPNGYNLRTGGNNSFPSEETIKRMSKARLKPSHPLNHKHAHDFMTVEEILQKNKNISLAKKGVSNPKVSLVLKGRKKENYGYLERNATLAKQRYVGAGNPNAKQIKVNGILFKTMKEAVASTGLSMYKLRNLKEI